MREVAARWRVQYMFTAKSPFRRPLFSLGVRHRLHHPARGDTTKVIGVLLGVIAPTQHGSSLGSCELSPEMSDVASSVRCPGAGCHWPSEFGDIEADRVVEVGDHAEVNDGGVPRDEVQEVFRSTAKVHGAAESVDQDRHRGPGPDQRTSPLPRLLR